MFEKSEKKDAALFDIFVSNRKNNASFFSLLGAAIAPDRGSCTSR